MMNKLLTTFVLGLVSIAAAAQSAPARPKLVVSIVVDQLRTDYLEYLKTLLGEKGFRRLMKESAYMRNVDFRPRNLDAVSATAMLYTGNYPDKTGIPAAQTYSRDTKRLQAPLHDATALGNFTEQTFSPRNLALSTISDEVMIDGAGLGLVYSIAADPQQAVIMSGHAGSGAVWLNTNNGRWATSTYYKDFPQTVSRRNYGNSLSQRIDTMQWKPSLALDRYPGIPAQKRYYPFRYTFPSSARDNYVRFAASPLCNEEITSIAVDCLNSLQLGNRGDAIDMLNIAYTAAPYKYVKDGDFRLELEDTYLKLDSQLGRLLDAIDKQVGLRNAVVMLSSTGYYDDATADAAKYGIPTGDFSIKRAISLLNAYFVAKYGNGNYVDAYGDGQFYLARKTFESKNISIEEGARQAKDFLRKMSGVADAYTIGEITSRSNPDLESLRLSVDPRMAGDVVVEIMPGWNLVDDTVYPTVTKQVRNCIVNTPVFIMAPGVASQTIDNPIDAASIAPTLTGILRIRAPNGACVKPVALF